MAKASVLQIFNQIQRNLGEPETSDMTTLSGMNYLIFTTMQEQSGNLALDYFWTPLEQSIDIPLVAGTSAYAPVNGVTSLNLYAIDNDSMKFNNTSPLNQYTFKSFDYQFPIQTSSGAPLLWYKWQEKINLYPIPDTNAEGKHVTGRGWSYPTALTTASPGATTWIPEGFDTTLFAYMVTAKILHYRQSPEWQFYNRYINGDGLEEGALSQFKRLYGSPEISSKNLVVEPMENRTTGNHQYIQGNIVG